MKYNSPLLITFILFLISGCGGSNVKQDSSDNLNAIKLPHWVFAPEQENTLSVVGSAMPQKIGGREGQRRAALLRARSLLAKRVNVYIKKELHIDKSSSQNTQLLQSIQSRSTGLQQLDGAFIKEEWVHPENGELFIWYVISVGNK